MVSGNRFEVVRLRETVRELYRGERTASFLSRRRVAGGWTPPRSSPGLLRDPEIEGGDGRMTRKGIPFSKLNGSGNDFLLVDNRHDVMRGVDRPSFVAKVCDRSRSIGADGVILIEPSRRADFRWDFYNADGSHAEMCGNGGRGGARFGAARRIAGREVAFEPPRGILYPPP